MNYNSFRRKTKYDREKKKKKDNFDFINKHYCEKGQLVLAGDSITEIFNMELFNKFSERTGLLVYNRGISGDTSDRLLERFDDNVLCLKPSALVLLIGTNDLSCKADPEYIFDNIKKIVELTIKKSHKTRIIIQAVYPVEARNKKKNQKIIELNTLIKTFCEKNGIVYVDTHSALLDRRGGFEDKYTYDGLHPNARGFEVVSKEIINALM